VPRHITRFAFSMLRSPREGKGGGFADSFAPWLAAHISAAHNSGPKPPETRQGTRITATCRKLPRHSPAVTRRPISPLPAAAAGPSHTEKHSNSPTTDIICPYRGLHRRTTPMLGLASEIADLRQPVEPHDTISGRDNSFDESIRFPTVPFLTDWSRFGGFVSRSIGTWMQPRHASRTSYWPATTRPIGLLQVHTYSLHSDSDRRFVRSCRAFDS